MREVCNERKLTFRCFCHLQDTFARLVPEPRGPCLEHLNMDRFFATPMLKIYIIEVRAVGGQHIGYYLPYILYPSLPRLSA